MTFTLEIFSWNDCSHSYGIVLIHHNDVPPHPARVTQEFLQGAGFDVLPWPSVYPYLNPIENVLAAMKSGLRERPVAGSSDDLFALLTEM